MALTYTLATDADLTGILTLQRNNLRSVLSEDDIRDQGFVTVQHDEALIRKLNEQEKHMIAKDGDAVVGYTLAMTRDARFDIPVLVSLFDQLEKINYRGKPLSTYHYLVVGQVCVDKNYRGQRVLDSCYAAYREQYQHKYQMAITDIVASNTRSRRAHERIGFQELQQFTDEGGTDWVIVVWDWREIN